MPASPAAVAATSTCVPKPRSIPRRGARARGARRLGREIGVAHVDGAIRLEEAGTRSAARNGEPLEVVDRTVKERKSGEIGMQLGIRCPPRRLFAGDCRLDVT